ncbi:hypothetical protein QZM48_04210 [Burkholderia orbicola]|uniref:hypothetical protein n=1 Tax=Burkholderia orbicola TaxID=2978683 RepID=UPI00264C6D4E|nr:hypothetical protein [Burkholderia orbicola]MDN7729210.1 hypothetical protein [Burkholderia orbicola]
MLHPHPITPRALPSAADVFAFELKQRILMNGARLAVAFTDSGARMQNAMCRELFDATGEVFSAGSFVRVGG